MRLPVVLLVLLCLAVGLAPALTAGPLLAVAAQAALYGAPGAPLPAYTLAIWHGLNLPLLMSGVAVVGGVAAVLRPAALHQPAPRGAAAGLGAQRRARRLHGPADRRRARGARR